MHNAPARPRILPHSTRRQFPRTTKAIPLTIFPPFFYPVSFYPSPHVPLNSHLATVNPAASATRPAKASKVSPG